MVIYWGEVFQMNLRAWPELAMHGATRDSDAFVTTFVELRRSAYIHPLIAVIYCARALRQLFFVQ